MEVTDTELFNTVFSEYPSEPNSKKIDGDPDLISQFELLIDLYIRAVLDYKRLLDIILTKQTIYPTGLDKEKLDLTKLSINILGIPQLWFNSMGYYIHIRSYTQDQYKADYFSINHYCKIIIKDNPNDEQYFNLRKIKNRYHFLINGSVDIDQIDELKDVYGIFYTPDDILYTVSFSQL